MTKGNDNGNLSAREMSRRPRRKPETAFDKWLTRSLHQMFDDVAREPIPDELLKLIEDDREN